MLIPNLFDDRAWFSGLLHMALATAFPTSAVLAGFPAGFRSAVTRPEFKTVSTARFTPAASSFNPKLYSSIAATDPIAPKGLALPCPAMSGADPCTGSYKPVQTPDGLRSPIDAEGSMPIDPAKTAPSSLRISP